MDILIFDMDGVLIDVSKSYRKTIQRTIQIYMENCLGFKRKKESWVTDEEISLFKSTGGFNNDWDLASGLLLYLISISRIPPLPKKKRFSSIQEIISYLKIKSFAFHQKTAIRLRRKHLLFFLEKVKTSGGGVRGVRRILGTSWDGWVYRSGDLDKDNLIKRIFQEVYLGKKFIAFYHLYPLFYRGKGYYLQERILIPKKILAALHGKIRMGIASGRPRFEAEVALKRFGLLSYFDSMVTLDECLEEEGRIFRSAGKRVKRSKPHPYSILRAIQEIGLPNPRCGYIGDVVDDILAAQAAEKYLPVLAIGFISDQRNRKTARNSLIQAGADLIIENPKDFLCFAS